jgi:hypothetical protein
VSQRMRSANPQVALANRSSLGRTQQSCGSGYEQQRIMLVLNVPGSLYFSIGRVKRALPECRQPPAAVERVARSGFIKFAGG